ncbi:unnamed protein product [Protopolystoma xenopodis]|uniref:Uncharacterized protein n=1 Tax=Protopolystoma xenopodis TaxID=117903 RepID=A0A448XJS5_9PLAT|nr:unnamed protein product [Protopolystoma xenopodis]
MDSRCRRDLQANSYHNCQLLVDTTINRMSSLEDCVLGERRQPHATTSESSPVWAVLTRLCLFVCVGQTSCEMICSDAKSCRHLLSAHEHRKWRFYAQPSRFKEREIMVRGRTEGGIILLEKPKSRDLPSGLEQVSSRHACPQKDTKSKSVCPVVCASWRHGVVCRSSRGNVQH